MKKTILKKFIALLAVCMFLSTFFLACEKTTDDENSVTDAYFNISYTATSGGYIYGEKNQRVLIGENGKEVTAVAKDGFVFNRWSDGITNETRYEENVQSRMTVQAVFYLSLDWFEQTANFSADANGHISGESKQTVQLGGKIEAVTAVLDEGYIFAGWSDGIMSNPRQDKRIQSNINATARFKQKIKTLTYNYNFTDHYYFQKDITISYDNLKDVSFIVPKREDFIFKGWYLEPEFRTMVANEDGIYFLGHGIFYSDSDDLYAKWIPKDSAFTTA